MKLTPTPLSETVTILKDLYLSKVTCPDAK